METSWKICRSELPVHVVDEDAIRTTFVNGLDYVWIKIPGWFIVERIERTGTVRLSTSNSFFSDVMTAYHQGLYCFILTKCNENWKVFLVSEGFVETRLISQNELDKFIRKCSVFNSVVGWKQDGF